MESFTYIIKCEIGIHARPAAMLVKKTQSLSSKISLAAEGKTADAKKLLALLKLGVSKETEVTVTLSGVKEKEEAHMLEQYFQNNL